MPVEGRAPTRATRVSSAKTIALGFRSAPGLPAIMADAGQVEQVIMNLARNAAEAIGDAPGKTTLATAAWVCSDAELRASLLDEKPPAGRFVCLEVGDTGCGMDAQVQQRLFEPFFSTKFAGRGLGMAAVMGIARGHRGAIYVDSEVSRGTRIRVLFPESPRRDVPTAAPAAMAELPEQVL